MSAHNDLDRQLNDFLRDGPTELPYQSFDAVRDRTEQTGQRVVIGPWRLPEMNRTITLGLGAAAVVVIGLLLGSRLVGTPDIGGPGEGTPTPQPTAVPATSTPEPSPSEAGGLPAGPHLILTGEGVDSTQDITPPLTVTLPAPDWYGEVGGGILAKNDTVEPPDGSGMIVFAQTGYIVYGDACHWRTTTPETPVTTVEDFISALSSQGSRDASEPVDITLGGYPGKVITLEVPDEVDFTRCDPGYGGSWSCGGAGMSPCGYHSGPGEIDTVYVLDVDGVIVAWNTMHYATTPAQDVAELEAIVQSASFGG